MFCQIFIKGWRQYTKNLLILVKYILDKIQYLEFTYTIKSVLLAIATNIPLQLKTGFVVQGHIETNSS